MSMISKMGLVGTALLVSSSYVNAADWLKLQGTQPEFIAPQGVIIENHNMKPKIWGFIQTTYRKDFGKIQVSPTGVMQTPFSRLNPDLSTQEGFNVFRARLAARGMADKDNKVNYFFMTEFGNNGINNPAGHRDAATYFSDASVTLKHVPYAKVRMGKFKFPGSEEGLQAVFVSPYITFTDFTFQQLLERKIRDVGTAQTGAAAGGAGSVHYTSTAIDQPVGAFRDTGVQIFDTIDLMDKWTLTYAYMYGNGSGISNTASNDDSTHYGYLALEENFGKGKGYYTEAMKFYVWGQNGTRTLMSYDATSATTSELSFDRKRYGLGATYYRNGLRAEIEYMKASGMIFTGAKDKDSDPLAEDWQYQFATGSENKADGGYVNVQYELLPKKFEVFGRYSFANRLTNDTKGEREFKTTTLGASYRFRGPTRLDVNYLFRDIKAPGNANAQKVLDNLGNRLEVQLTAAF